MMLDDQERFGSWVGWHRSAFSGMWCKETGCEERLQLISFLINPWREAILSRSGSVGGALRGRLAATRTEQEQTSKPRNSGCQMVSLKTWLANGSSCKHRVRVNSNTNVQWGKWSTEKPWECRAVFFQCTSLIRFYFPVALVAIYSVSCLLRLEVLGLQLTLNWQQHTSLFLSPWCRPAAHLHGLGALTGLVIAGASLGRACILSAGTFPPSLPRHFCGEYQTV